MRTSLLVVLSSPLLLAATLRDARACTCPDAGPMTVIRVDARFDQSPPRGVIDDAEIQCAIDCLPAEMPARLSRPASHPPPTPAPSAPHDYGLDLTGSKGFHVIAGGTLEFVPALSYQVRHPLHLPAGASGQIILEGNGASILDLASTPILERVVPLATGSLQAANSADARTLAASARNWVIRDFVFSGVSATTAILDLEAMEMPLVEHCQFVAPDETTGDPYLYETGASTYIHLDFCPKAVITDCLFRGARVSDVVLAGENARLAGRPPWPMGSMPDRFTGQGSASSVVTQAMGCDGAHLAQNVHDSPQAAVTACDVQDLDTDALTLTREVVTGTRPGIFVFKGGTGADPPVTSLWLEDLRFSTNSSDTWPYVALGSPGSVVLDGLTLTPHGSPGSAHDLLLAPSGNPPPLPGRYQVVVENVPYLPRGVIFKHPDEDDPFETWEWSFYDANMDPGPLDPSRWKDDGRPPRFIAVEDAATSTIPSTPPPVRDTFPTPENCDATAGAIWTDGASVKLTTNDCASTFNPRVVTIQQARQ